MAVIDPATRFSDRVEDYVRARPSYPSATADLLRAECGLGPAATVADLGSGTGIFTRLLLETGATVFAVEPNDAMRAAADHDLGEHPRYRGVRGRAEATTLPARSIDLATAAQAFHWFDLGATREELARILRPSGKVALVWNDRDTDSTPLHRELSAILALHCPEYQALQGRGDAREAFDALFGTGRWSSRTVPNTQRLDRDGLVARVMSASYAPRATSPGAAAMTAELEALFDRHVEPDAAVRIAYATVVVWGDAPAA